MPKPKTEKIPDSISPEMCREMGKLYFFHGEDEASKETGLKYLKKAQAMGDAEAAFCLGKLILSGDAAVPGNPEETALPLLQYAANSGVLEARTLLNNYCLIKYKINRFLQDEEHAAPPKELVDNHGKKIKIDTRKKSGAVSAVLEQRDGKNVFSVDVRLSFVYPEKIFYFGLFEEAIKRGITAWEGEYEVFGGQPLTVKINIIEDSGSRECVYVVPVTGSIEQILARIGKTASALGEKKLRGLLKEGRSFAVTQGKWRSDSAKFIYIMSDNGEFDDYTELMHTAKHEFGHVLGLGDLYPEDGGKLRGISAGRYSELENYRINGDMYNLVMCDHHGVISNSDIEMVVLAFRDNKAQLYTKHKFK